MYNWPHFTLCFNVYVCFSPTLMDVMIYCCGLFNANLNGTSAVDSLFKHFEPPPHTSIKLFPSILCTCVGYTVACTTQVLPCFAKHTQFLAPSWFHTLFLATRMTTEAPLLIASSAKHFPMPLLPPVICEGETTHIFRRVQYIYITQLERYAWSLP